MTGAETISVALKKLDFNHLYSVQLTLFKNTAEHCRCTDVLIVCD